MVILKMSPLGSGNEDRNGGNSDTQNNKVGPVKWLIRSRH